MKTHGHTIHHLTYNTNNTLTSSTIPIACNFGISQGSTLHVANSYRKCKSSYSGA